MRNRTKSRLHRKQSSQNREKTAGAGSKKHNHKKKSLSKYYLINY